ncbi:hypothetical protein C366_04468 [Cryptococcus neoformans Tu401-1]|nr:hypothetical protein C365_05974 [Cryptococcus neoformans var. grubii Bt85]OXG15330.1 hypothetical protein C366_04468 [Cryptococcus neoformans var. grubii Tu401-1]OXM78024.1 hypothetical protein C364_04451 [Cryptococcus neoformans var. grubii Bt63]
MSDRSEELLESEAEEAAGDDSYWRRVTGGDSAMGDLKRSALTRQKRKFKPSWEKGCNGITILRSAFGISAFLV